MDELRYSPPSKYEAAPYGFVTEVRGDDGKSSSYIQVSNVPDVYNWIPIGDFLTQVFSEQIKDPDFIKENIKTYERRN
jgi:hypothetical protein